MMHNLVLFNICGEWYKLKGSHFDNERGSCSTILEAVYKLFRRNSPQRLATFPKVAAIQTNRNFILGHSVFVDIFNKN